MLNFYHIHEYAKRFVLCTPILGTLYGKFRKRNNEKARLMLANDGLRIASDISSCFVQLGISGFIACGSLLGLVRDGHFIESDDDLDFAILPTDRHDWMELKRLLQSHGYVLKHYFTFNDTIVEQCYSYGDLTFDIFSFEKSDNEYRMYSFIKYPHYIYDSPSDCSAIYYSCSEMIEIMDVCFSGYNISLPKNAEYMLTVWYGSKWSVPDPNWVYWKHAKRIDEPHGVMHLIS